MNEILGKLFLATNSTMLGLVALCPALVPPAAPLQRGGGVASPTSSLFKQVTRRSAVTAAGATALLAAAPSLAAPTSSDGKWARHEEFADDFFAGFSRTPSGLEYKVFAEGYGVQPRSGQGIKAHYSGYLLNGAIFDSSYERRKPLGFDVGLGRVIKGWDEALLDMKVGEQRILRIPSNLAYGSKGAGGIIPPDATLVFYVELVALTS